MDREEARALTLEVTNTTHGRAHCGTAGDSEGLARAMHELQQLAEPDASQDDSSIFAASANPDGPTPLPGAFGVRGSRSTEGAQRGGLGSDGEALPNGGSISGHEGRRGNQAAATVVGATAASSPPGSHANAANPTGATADAVDETLDDDRAEPAPPSPSESAPAPMPPAVYLKACQLQVPVQEGRWWVDCSWLWAFGTHHARTRARTDRSVMVSSTHRHCGKQQQQ